MNRNALVIAALLGLLSETEANTLKQMMAKKEDEAFTEIAKEGSDSGSDKNEDSESDHDHKKDDDNDSEDDKNESEDDVQLDDYDDKNQSEDDEQLDENEQVQLRVDTETTTQKLSDQCLAPKKRWGGKSNSWATFNSAHQTNSGIWKDTTFGADADSLYDVAMTRDTSDIPSLKKITGWKRPSELIAAGQNASFWGPTGSPIPNGVSQRSLGDCWFLAAASAITETPSRLKRVVWNDSYDKNGAFRFYFWVKNKWEGINVDDRLPARQYYGSWRTWSTSESKKGAWWMPLMEKAYAKLDGNYERLIGGMGYEGLRTLTGMPTAYVSLKKGKDHEATFKTLHALAKRNFPMTTPCCNGGQGVDGLVSGHAYTLLDVLQLSTGDKLAKLRNPWASERYTGDWSDKSSKWTDALKKEVGGLVNENEGVFYMPFKTYTENYWGTSIALYQPYKGYKVLDVAQTTRTVWYTVTNPIDQEMYISGDTWSNRNFPRTCNPNNSYVMILYKGNTRIGNYAYMGSKGFGLRGGKIGEKLAKGTYRLLFINQRASSGQTANVSFNVYWTDKAGDFKKE